MDKPMPMSISDMDGVSEAIITLVSKYPDLPFKAKESTVQWQSLPEEGIGMFTESGAVYLKRYIGGSFVGQLPFQIMYRVKPTNNKARLNSQKVLEGLTRWLETCTASFKDNSLQIRDITRSTPVTKLQAENGGDELYVCSMNVQYFSRN